MSRNEQSSACNTSQDIPDALASSDIRDPLPTAVSVVHSVTMIAAGGILAWLVYRYLGLKFVGILVVLPLMLVIAGEPRDLWRSRALPVALPMLLFFALFVTIFVRVSKWEHVESLVEFRLLSHEIVDKIRTGLEEQEVFLEQLERSFSVPEE